MIGALCMFIVAESFLIRLRKFPEFSMEDE